MQTAHKDTHAITKIDMHKPPPFISVSVTRYSVAIYQAKITNCRRNFPGGRHWKANHFRVCAQGEERVYRHEQRVARKALYSLYRDAKGIQHVFALFLPLSGVAWYKRCALGVVCYTYTKSVLGAIWYTYRNVVMWCSDILENGTKYLKEPLEAEDIKQRKNMSWSAFFLFLFLGQGSQWWKIWYSKPSILEVRLRHLFSKIYKYIIYKYIL